MGDALFYGFIFAMTVAAFACDVWRRRHGNIEDV